MCESSVYLEENGRQTEFMKDVAKLEFTYHFLLNTHLIHT